MQLPSSSTKEGFDAVSCSNNVILPVICMACVTVFLMPGNQQVSLTCPSGPRGKVDVNTALYQ